MQEANVQTSELYTLQLPSKPESITLLEALNRTNCRQTPGERRYLCQYDDLS